MAVRALHAFDAGRFKAPRWLIPGGVGWLAGLGLIDVPVLCFAIEVADGGSILVDFGADASLHVAGRERLGVARDRIRALVLTHLDADHTAALPGLSDVPLYIARDEWAARANHRLRDRLARRHKPSDYAGLREVRELIFDGDRAPIPEGGGDVSLVSLPGHTPGHAGVLVRVEGGKDVLLCGDACYATEQIFEPDYELSGLVRLAAVDWGRCVRTIDGLRRRHAAEPALKMVPSHDPRIGASCSPGPVRIA